MKNKKKQFNGFTDALVDWIVECIVKAIELSLEIIML